MKSILIIVPYENIYPPMNGGMQRCFHIIHQLAKYFDLTAIIHQDKEGFVKSVKEYPAINNIKIYSTKDGPGSKQIFSLIPAKLENAIRYRWIKKQLKISADGMFMEYYPALVKLLKQNKYDAIILENLNAINAVSVIRKYDKKVKIVYDAHNVDTNLCADAGLKIGIQNVESNLYKNVDALLSCSENDRADFLKMNNNKLPVAVIPNGVRLNNLYDEGVNQEVPAYILFCGVLSSAPNREGLLWFYYKVWPVIKKTFPRLKFLIVGSGNPPESFQPLLSDPSLVFTWAVDDVKPWYNKAAIAIVPLLSGSGTRLKILEAMSYGLPVISTSKGAEGIEFRNNEDIIIAGKDNEFANRLVALLRNKSLRIRIQENARKLVEEKYEWNIIGESLFNFIKDNHD